MVKTSGMALLALIDNILDLSKVEAGKIVLESRAFNVNDTVEDLVRLLEEQAKARGLQIDSRVSSKIPGLLLGDANRLRQVLMNLTSNAIKFTQVGTVTVIAELDAPSNSKVNLRFTVTDRGLASLKIGSRRFSRPSFRLMIPPPADMEAPDWDWPYRNIWWR